MFLSALQLMARRSLAYRGLLSAVIIGVLLAVAIMSATALYFDSLRNLALQHDLEQFQPSGLDVLIEAKQSPTDRDGYATITDYVEPRIERHLSWFASRTVMAYKSDTFFPANDGDELPPPSDNRRRGTFVVMPGIQENASLITGTWPAPTAPAVGDALLIVDAAIPANIADYFSLEKDDLFDLAPFWDAKHDRIQARVTGIFARDDPEDPFWRVFDDALDFGSTSFQFATFIVPEATMLDAIGTYFPILGAKYGWLVDFDTDRLHAADSATARVSLDTIDTEFTSELDGFRLRTSLNTVLSRFDTRLFFNKVPMFVVLVLIVLVILYYVSTIAGLLVDAQKEEIGLLRSRGGTGRQIILVYATEAFVMSAIAIPVGPYVAAAAINLVGVLPWFSELNEGGRIPVQITAGVFRLSALGAGLSLLALLLPSIRAARMGLLEHRMAIARPPRLPAFQRYYLDLATLGLVMFLFYQLQQRGSFVATNLLGDEKVNQLILTVPALMLVAAGVVLLRLFPISMEILGRILSSRFVSPISSPSLVLGVWQMARNPAHHSRLSLLLILTASLGVFAATFAGTLDQSFVDRVYYESGSDVRAVDVRLSGGDRGRSIAAEKTLRELDGVAGITPVIRGGGALISDIAMQFEYVGIDGATFPGVGYTRTDFGPRPIEEALGRLGRGDDAGFPIPQDAISIFVRVRPFRADGSVNVIARISDANSRIFTLNLGTTVPTGADSQFGQCPRREEPTDPPPWCTIGGSLRLLGINGGEVEPPLKLEFLSVSKLNNQDGSGGLAPGAMIIDKIGVRMADGSDRILDDFDDLAGWGALGTTLNDYGGTIAALQNESGAPVPGEARLSWGGGQIRKLNGVLAGKLRQSIPVLASSNFLERSSLVIGDEVDVFLEDREVLIQIVDRVEYFPTMDPNREAFLVAHIQSAWRALGVNELGDARRVDEYWVQFEPDAEPDPEAVERAITARSIQFADLDVRADRLSVSDIDPLSKAGWKALLVIAFLAVLVVSAIGFLVHAQVTFQGRRSELALLRATGLSMKQLLSLVLLEQVLVIGAAFAIGAYMGARLGATIMPFLGTSGEGLKIVPPMAQQISWGSFGITFGVIGVVFGVVISVLLLAVFRMSIHAVMRMGER